MQADGDMDDDVQFLHNNLEQVDNYTGVYLHFIGYMYDHSGTSLVLLDSCSTVNLIANKNLLHGIHQAKTTMWIHCTTGIATTNLQGWLGDFLEWCGTSQMGSQIFFCFTLSSSIIGCGVTPIN